MPPLRTATRFLFDAYQVIPEEQKVVFEYVIEYPDHPAERFRESLTLPFVTSARVTSASRCIGNELLEDAMSSRTCDQDRALVGGTA